VLRSDAVLPERFAALDRLAVDAAADPDAWSGLRGFLVGLFALQAGDRAINEAVARNPVGPSGMAAECGSAGGAVEVILARAHAAGVLRADFGPGDLATLIQAMSAVIATAADETIWRRHLGFVLDDLRAR
jgi:hypothetical protein